MSDLRNWASARPRLQDTCNLAVPEPNPGTSLKEGATSKTSTKHIYMLNHLQRFDTSEWSKICFAEVEKQYTSIPGYTCLKCNDEIACLGNDVELSCVETSYAALTMAIIKQQEALQEGFLNLLSWMRSPEKITHDKICVKINDIFTKGEYCKVSNDIIQLTCGRRADLINQRRSEILSFVKDPVTKLMLRKIPPSCHNLFSGEQFTNALNKVGGARKIFGPKLPRKIYLQTYNTELSPAQGFAYYNPPAHGATNERPKLKPRHSRHKPSSTQEQVRHGNCPNHTGANDGKGYMEKMENSQGNEGESVTNHDAIVTRNTNATNTSTKPFRAGQLQHFINKWEKLGAPRHIIAMIKGYRIPFKAKPPLINQRLLSATYQTPSSPEMTAVMSQMESDHVLEVAQTKSCFLSKMFLRPKGDGTWRPIFNLKGLNYYVHTPKFRLISVYKVPDFLQHQDWLVKIDISQAYFHVPVSQSHRKFLRLIYNQKLMQMTCLPFGLSSAPSAFASITAWIAQLLRNKGLRVLIYLDDFLLAHQNRSALVEQVKFTIDLLHYLGWQVNMTKSVIIPQKEIEYLGITWDPWNNLKKLPPKKVALITEVTLRTLNCNKLSYEEGLSILGLLNFGSFAVPRGRLHIRYLQKHISKTPENNYRYLLTPRVTSDLQWWLENCKHPSKIHENPPTCFLTTDAARTAWGARLNNLDMSGIWLSQEINLHSNQKELLAVTKVLELKKHTLSNQTILLQSDNTSVLAYLRNEGGTKSKALMQLTYRVYQILDRHNITLITHHIPGIYNSEADHLSRQMISPEWHLLTKATKTIFAKWGVPTIDLFASRLAHVVKPYCSMDLSDGEAAIHNAFAHKWDFHLAWVFPPPCLIPRVLNHLNEAKGVYLVVAPRWDRVFWRPDIKNRAIDAPFTIRDLQRVLIDASTGKPLPRAKEMTLEVWKCNGGRKNQPVTGKFP